MPLHPEMIAVTILPPGKGIAVKPGTILLDAIRKAGIEIATPCNGQGLCGKCKIHIAHAPPATAPHPLLTAAEVAAGFRLACQVAVHQEMTVTLPADHSLDTRILAGERITRCRCAPAARVEKIDDQWQLRYGGKRPGAPGDLAVGLSCPWHGRGSGDHHPGAHLDGPWHRHRTGHGHGRQPPDPVRS